MTTSDPILITDTRPALPSVRRYCVWRLTMWLIIMYAALVGMGAAFALLIVGGRLELPSISLGGQPFVMTLARNITRSPALPMLAGFALVPLAIIACYRASMGKHAMWWLLGYWLLAGTLCLLLVSSCWALWYEAYRYLLQRNYSLEGFSRLGWVTEGLLMSVISVPHLPLTLLAALLALERKNRPPAMEAGP